MPKVPNFSSPRLLIHGGWATDRPTMATGISHLLTAENVVFIPQGQVVPDAAPSGSVLKRGGLIKYNSSALQIGGTDVKFRGIFDYWKQGTGLLATQAFLAHVDNGSIGKIYKDDGDGVWDDISGSTSFEFGKHPSYCVFEDIVILSTDSIVDVPQKWNQSGNIANLGGSPPNFAFAITHVNRVWGAGVASNPSRLYYSVGLDGEDWTGGDAGSIDIDPEDGDRILGLASHRDELFVFKGPHKLSIHRIQGKTEATFSRLLLARGVGASSHNSIIPIKNDLLFVDPMGIHSLKMTEAYGDFEEAFLSEPIASYFQDKIALDRLNDCYGSNHNGGRYAIWLITGKNKTQNNMAIGLDYSFNPPWLFKWPIAAASVASRTKSNGQRGLYLGRYDGFTVEADRRDDRADLGSAFSAIVETPHIHFGEQLKDKNFSALAQVITPVGNHNITLNYIIGEDASVATTVPQSPGGFVLGTSKLGTGVLLSNYRSYLRYATAFEGQGRTMKLKYTQAGLRQSMQIDEIIPSLTVGDIRED